MIDIHSHILPGLDDGARSIEESLQMLNIAGEAGTKVIAATPHANPTYHYDPERIDELLTELQAAAGTGIVLVRGSDFHLMHSNIMDALSSPGKYALNGKCYLLVELSDLVIFPNTGDQYQRLEDCGLKLIVTHPERNLILQRRPELIEEWVAQGRLMQVTAGSLLGRFGKRAQQLGAELVEKGLAHFLASDAHDTEHRPPRLDQGFQWLCQNHSRALAEQLCIEFPRAAIDGAEIDLEGFPPAKAPEAPEGGLWRRLFGRG
jgi:protein-tyrosine phosphatase